MKEIYVVEALGFFLYNESASKDVDESYRRVRYVFCSTISDNNEGTCLDIFRLNLGEYQSVLHSSLARNPFVECH